MWGSPRPPSASPWSPDRKRAKPHRASRRAWPVFWPSPPRLRQRPNPRPRRAPIPGKVSTACSGLRRRPPRQGTRQTRRHRPRRPPIRAPAEPIKVLAQTKERRASISTPPPRCPASGPGPPRRRATYGEGWRLAGVRPRHAGPPCWSPSWPTAASPAFRKLSAVATPPSIPRPSWPSAPPSERCRPARRMSGWAEPNGVWSFRRAFDRPGAAIRTRASWRGIGPSEPGYGSLAELVDLNGGISADVATCCRLD